MKQNVSPGMAAIIVVVVVAVVGFFLWRVYTGPTARPASKAEVAAARKQPVGGGPDAKAMEYIKEYQRTHPGAPSSIH